MSDLWAALAALGAVLVPLALAGWLLGREGRRDATGQDPHGKMPRRKEH